MQYLTGFHAILEALRAGTADARLLVAAGPGSPRPGPRVRELIDAARKSGVTATSTDSAALDRIAPGHRGVALEVAAARTVPVAHFEDFLAQPRDSGLVLVLDHIEDPQNLGAILRSADAFRVDLVLAPARRSSPLTEAATRASAGASSWVPFAVVNNLGDSLRRLKKAGFWTYAADMAGTALPSSELPAMCAIVLGNEGSGVSRLLGELCDGTLSIPMGGHVDSLNVSAACAVMLYEYRRQRPA